MMISQCMTEMEQYKLVHVKIDLRRIMVLSWYDQVQTSLANPCQNEKSIKAEEIWQRKQKKC